MRNIKGELELELLYTPETTTLGKIKNVVFGAAFYIAWAAFVIFLYQTFIPEFQRPSFSFNFPPSLIKVFISSCILAPLWEEAIFRSGLSLFKRLDAEKYILHYVVISSVIFGILHQGIFSIPVQGVAGLMFCYVYLKNGYSYVSSVACHFLVNFYYFLNQ